MLIVPHWFAQRPADSKLVTSQQQITRRRFLGSTAATAGGILIPGVHRLAAGPIVAPSELASTDHFWYRPQPAGPYIDSQRDNKAFGFDDASIFLSEDNAREEKQECHWLKGVYDADNDKWRWTVLVSGPSNSRYKAGGINFIDGKLYWVADANGPKSHDRGIFRCDPTDIARPEAHTMLFNPQYESANMIIQDGVILASYYATASPYTLGFIISADMGRTWAQYDLKEFGRRSPVRFHKKNSNGWFRVDLRSGWIKRAEMLFIKPK